MNNNIQYIKYINYVITLVFVVIAILIMNRLLSQTFIKDPPVVQEGFTTYFRQTIRPHVRRIGYVRDAVSYQFTKRFGDFGKGLGIF